VEQIKTKGETTVKKSPKPQVASPMVHFGTINDLQNDIEKEIASIKDGSLSEAKARIVAKNRDLQIRTVELMLAAARIEAKFRPALSTALGLPAGTSEKQIPTLTQ
jgi:hypothetical protein